MLVATVDKNEIHCTSTALVHLMPALAAGPSLLQLSSVTYAAGTS
jgi:hypothetical protein